MPYYDNSLYGPSEEPSGSLQSPTRGGRPGGGGGAAAGGGGAGRLMPPDDADDAERPMRRRRDILSPVPSPIPNSPAYHSYREDAEGETGRGRYTGSEGHGAAGALRLPRRSEDMDETYEQPPPSRPRASASFSPPVPLSHIPPAGAASQYRPVEEFLSLPRAASFPRNPGAASAVRAVRYAPRDGDDAAGTPVRRRDNAGGLVSSRPRPAMRGAIEPLSHGIAAPHRAPRNGEGSGDDDAGGAGVDSGPAAPGARQRRSPHRRSPHQSGAQWSHAATTGAVTEREEDDNGAFSDASSPPVQCARCGYRLPVEMQSYLQETSSRRSVPPLHCPECGSRLVPAPTDATRAAGERRRSSHASARGAPQEERNGEEPPSPHQHRRRSHRRDPRVEGGSGDDGDDADEEAARQQEQPPEPRRSRRPTATAARAPKPPPRLPEPDAAASPSPPPPKHAPASGRGNMELAHEPQQPSMVLRKYPYLTPDLLPRSLDAAARATRAAPGGRPSSASPSEAEGIAVPWAVHSCAACNRQSGACLAGVFCCCAMPCILFRERQLLLFHRLRSRYVCCAGAFPCCVPPPALRPELYHTMGPEYFHGASEAEQQRYWQDIDAALERAEGGNDVAQDHGGALRPHLADLRSSRGVASPSSLVNPQTGLPLEGCYANSTARAHRHHPGAAPSAPSSSQQQQQQRIGTGCCDCCVCVDSTCVCDCTRGCCVYCAHPTACCLACPLCCLCCEMTFCMPCALWANRLLIRQHYHLTPDSAVDSGAGCCYACCVACCRCSCGPAPPSPPTSLSCWGQLAASVAACLGAVCCQCPCASCALAQQRDQIKRLGYPLVMEIPPEMEML